MPVAPSSAPVCKFFIQNTCSYGDQCRYHHPEQATSPAILEPRPRSVCAFYTKGSCVYGDQCRNIHIQTPSGRSPYIQGIIDSAKPASVFTPCKFFKRGNCAKGLACPFPHVSVPSVPQTRVSLRDARETVKETLEDVIDGTTLSVEGVVPDEDMSEPARNASEFVTELPESTAHHQIHRVFLGCKVTFGTGASISSIRTAFESYRLILSNLPSNITSSELISLTEPFGPLEKVIVDGASTVVFPSARIDFVDPASASLAVNDLNNKQFKSRQLGARLDLSVVESGSATLLSRKVKISWFSPSLVAWAHYTGISAARAQAGRLNGMTFEGRKITAIFQPPKRRQTCSFSVEVRGLPPYSGVEQLRNLLETKSVTLGHPTYIKLTGTESIRQKLLEFGPLESFDVIPDNRNKAKITAFAQFCTPQAASLAVEKLHNVPQPTLKRGPLWLELVHSLKYIVPVEQFVILRSEIDGLRDASNECKIRYYDQDESGQAVDPVCIRMYGSEPKSLGWAKVALEMILHGEILMFEGQPVWNDYLVTERGNDFVREVCATSQSFLKCDSRSRTIRVFGDPANRQLAGATILRKVEEIIAERHVIPLEKDMLRILLRGGIASLQESSGVEGLVLDIVARTLTVHGSDEDVGRINRAVLSMRTCAVVPGTVAETTCPVCFCEVTDPSVLPCGHKYCTMCLQHMMRSAAEAPSPSVSCVEEVREGDKTVPCGRQIPLAIIRDLLSPAEEGRLLEASLLSYIHARPEKYRYCPTPDCQIIYCPGQEGTAVRCPACLNRICVACHVEFHEGLTCADHRDNISGGLVAFRKWREANNVKPCPNCGADLQKSGGCNHMTCIRCRTHICWVCMRTFSDNGSDGGVYKHMRDAHGGIGG